MPEIIRTRDCIILVKGDSVTVTVSPDMSSVGWPGGQGVQWVDSTIDEFMVTFSDGYAAGFLIWGSDEEADRFTAMTRQQPTYRYAVMLFGGGILLTRTYEKYTYASRTSGPLVPIQYNPNDTLFFSLRGLWTNEDEWAASGDPRAPNTRQIGYVCQIPKSNNNYFLGIQYSM